MVVQRNVVVIATACYMFLKNSNSSQKLFGVIVCDSQANGVDQKLRDCQTSGKATWLRRAIACKQTFLLREEENRKRTSAVKRQNWDSALCIIKHFAQFFAEEECHAFRQGFYITGSKYTLSTMIYKNGLNNWKYSYNQLTN